MQFHIYAHILLATVVTGLNGTLYKPNTVGISRDAPPEIGAPATPLHLSEGKITPPERPPVKQYQDFRSDSLPLEESPSPRFSSQGAGSGSRGLARSAPLAPPAGGPQRYSSDSYRDNPSELRPRYKPPPYTEQPAPTEIIPVGYDSSQESYKLPQTYGPQAPPSFDTKSNPFVDPQATRVNPYAPNVPPLTSPKRPVSIQSVENGGFTSPRQEDEQPNPYQPSQSKQALPQKPYNPTAPSGPRGNSQFIVPQTLSTKLDNSIPPPPATNRASSPANSLPGTPAFPAPFGFPENLNVGQNSPFKNLVSFNSPRPFKSRAAAPFPANDAIFGSFTGTSYDNVGARPSFSKPESSSEVTAQQPAAPAPVERAVYPVDYPKAPESQTSYATAPRSPVQDFRQREPTRYQNRPAENPYYSQPRNSNPGYAFPTQEGNRYSNPYGYSSAQNGQCFRYTFAAEGYRLSDIAKSYPEDAIKKELEQKPYLAPLVGLKVDPEKQQDFNNFFQFDYSGFGFNNRQNDAEKYKYLLNSKVYPGQFKQGDFAGGYPSSMRPLDTSCPSQEYKLRSFFHHGGDCYVVNPEWQQITYNRCSRRECNFCGVNRGLSACVEDYRWFTVVAYCSKLEENSRIAPLRLILPVGCTCQHFAC